MIEDLCMILINVNHVILNLLHFYKLWRSRTSILKNRLLLLFVFSSEDLQSFKKKSFKLINSLRSTVDYSVVESISSSNQLTHVIRSSLSSSLYVYVSFFSICNMIIICSFGYFSSVDNAKQYRSLNLYDD